MAKMKVQDTTATAVSGMRTHDILCDGRVFQYSFKPGEALEMPPAHAWKFVPIDSFIVTDEKDNRIRQTIPITKGVETGQLKDDECIARYEELTIEALLSRAVPLPGGERMGRQSGKEGLAAFLIAARKTKTPSAPAADTASGEAVEELEPEEAAKLMDGIGEDRVAA